MALAPLWTTIRCVHPTPEKKLLNAYQFYAVVQQEKWAHLKVDLETSLSHPKAHTQRKGLA